MKRVGNPPAKIICWLSAVAHPDCGSTLLFSRLDFWGESFDIIILEQNVTLDVFTMGGSLHHEIFNVESLPDLIVLCHHVRQHRARFAYLF